MTYKELLKAMREFNEKHDIKRKVDLKYNDNKDLIKMTAVVIIKQQAFKKPYKEELRTYTFTNYNKALTSSDLGYSIFAYCVGDDSIERIENCSDNDFENCEIIEIIE